MKLTTEQIRQIAKGVLEVTSEGDGCHLWRMAKCHRDTYTEGKILWKRACGSSSVMLDFYTDAQTLSLSLSDICWGDGNACYIDILENGILTQSKGYGLGELPPAAELKEAGLRVDFSLSPGEKRVTVCFPIHHFRLDSVELTEGASIRPYTHKGKFLAIGDSITEGMGADHPSMSYVNRIGRELDAEIHNFSVRAEMFSAKKIVPGSYPESDFVLFAYGTNDFLFSTPEVFGPQMVEFLDNATAEFRGKPMFLLLPIWREDWQNTTQFGTFSDLQELMRSTAEQYPTVTVIDCWNFVPHDPKMYMDGEHPTDEGFRFYAEALLGELKKHLKK